MRNLSLLLLALLSLNARASFLIEPYAGYGMGSVQRTLLSGTAGSASVSGFAYGGRAGFVASHLAILAADYQGMSGKEKVDTAAKPNGWRQSALYVDMGFQTTMGFRMLAGYAFNSELVESGTPDVRYKGTAYKIVLGWILPDDIALNAEYAVHRMSTIESGGATLTVKDTYSKFEYAAGMVTLSLPITFFGTSGHGR